MPIRFFCNPGYWLPCSRPRKRKNPDGRFDPFWESIGTFSRYVTSHLATSAPHKPGCQPRPIALAIRIQLHGSWVVMILVALVGSMELRNNAFVVLSSIVSLPTCKPFDVTNTCCQCVLRSCKLHNTTTFKFQTL